MSTIRFATESGISDGSVLSAEILSEALIILSSTKNRNIDTHDMEITITVERESNTVY